MFRIINWKNEVEAEFTTAKDTAQYIADNANADEYYKDMIDECYGDIEIMGMHYCASTALERLDPIAYRCGYSDWMDGEYSDMVYEFERMEEGEYTDKFDYSIEFEADEE